MWKFEKFQKNIDFLKRIGYALVKHKRRSANVAERLFIVCPAGTRSKG